MLHKYVITNSIFYWNKSHHLFLTADYVFSFTSKLSIWWTAISIQYFLVSFLIITLMHYSTCSTFYLITSYFFSVLQTHVMAWLISWPQHTQVTFTHQSYHKHWSYFATWQLSMPTFTHFICKCQCMWIACEFNQLRIKKVLSYYITAQP